jgi:hypothetical protein
VVDTGTEHERTFYGVRVFLESPSVLHHSPDDDDRSAITFWVPWTKADGHDFALVQSVMINLHNRVGEAIVKELDQRVNAKREQTPAGV